MSKSLTEKEKKFIFDTLKKYLSDVEDLQIFLFGSMAKGTARKNSDIDIAIKTDGPLNKSLWTKIESELEESDLLREVDVVDYWRVTPEFQEVIGREGKVILASKSHPFRLCPVGYHWVSTHPRNIAPSLVHPTGYITEVDGHCRANPGGGKGDKRSKEILTADELREMFKRYGTSAIGTLRAFKEKDKMNWNKFDKQIIFWTQFWNEVLKPKVRLDPHMVKALIGSESSFNLKPDPQNAGGAGIARGLIQITDEAKRILSDQSGELKDYLIEFNEEDLFDENVSIGAGVRWLFHKKKLADKLLKRESSWEEALINYKGYLNQYRKNPKKKFKGMARFKELDAELNN